MKGLVQTLRGTVAVVSIVALILAGTIPLFLASLAKFLLPWPRYRQQATRTALAIARSWAQCTNATILAISGTRVHCDLQIPDHPEGRYILISNHQCWADALLLIHATNAHLPFPRFFVKQQLRWLPVIGLAFWALDFPFLKRHGRAELKANPALRKDDANAVRKACAIFRRQPVLLVNYAEGTRATREKRMKFDSPYRTLLPPKAGGTALAMNALNDVLDGVLDMTVAYAGAPEPTFWDLLCGRIDAVMIRVRRLEVPNQLLSGDYGTDANYRDQFKHWLSAIWETKDEEVFQVQSHRKSS